MNFLYESHFLLGLGTLAWLLVGLGRVFSSDLQLKKDLRGSLYLFTFFVALRALGAGFDDSLSKGLATALRTTWMLAFAFGSVRAFVSAGLWAFRRLRR